MNHYTAIGYPLGISKAPDNTIAFCLETQQGMVFLTLDEFHAWTRFVSQSIPEPFPAEHAASLEAKGALLCARSRSDWENVLQQCQAMRQGYSAIDESGHFIISLAEKKHTLTPLQFKLWLCADGIQHLSTGVFQLFLDQDEKWPEAICSLMAKELLFLR